MANNTSRSLSSFRQTTLGHMALEKADKFPGKTAIFTENDGPITFSSIALEAKKLAVAFRHLGLTAGDVISFQLPNWRETVAIDIAASLLGIIVNPIIPIYRERELSFILKDAGSKLLFIPDQYRSINYRAMIESLRSNLPALKHVVIVRGSEQTESDAGYDHYSQLLDNEQELVEAAEVDPDSIKTIMYTSGTTGVPKAVMHTHNTLARAIDNTATAWGLDAEDVMLMPSPVTHITGFANGIEMPFFTETRSALIEQWKVEKAVSVIKEVNATVCVSATPFLQEIVDYAEQHKELLPSMRLFACGGASVPPDLIKRVPKVLERCMGFRVYGSTEAPLVTVGFINEDQHELAAHTDGLIFNWEVRIVNDSGEDVPVGEDGEITVRGPALMAGYKDVEQTKSAITAGFFHTGDIGHITPDNAIVITDRKKDLIIRGGENLSAKEIEDVLHTHLAIHEAAVVAMPHQRLGEGVCAFIVLEKGFSEDDLSTKLLQPMLENTGLARQKWPERIEIVDDLIRTASGKVRKDILRQQLKDKAGAEQ